jgi:hypothetical protein
MLRRAITRPIQAPTALQADFVEAYLDGNNPTQSALLAGCAPSWAAHAGSKYLKDSGVAFAIVKGALKRFAGRIPMAIGVLDFLAQNAVSEKVRLDAATRILHLAGIVPPKAEANSNTIDRALHELSVGELRALVARYEDDRASSAKPIITVSESETAPIEDDLIG